MGAAWVEMLPVSRFHGLGPVTAEKMKRLGIESGADLRSKSLEFLQRHFGSSADWYHAIARGEDHRPVNPNRVQKSSGSETTFNRDLTEPSEIEAGVLRMADDVWRWCETRQAFGRTVTVKVSCASVSLIAVTWMALKPRLFNRSDTQEELPRTICTGLDAPQWSCPPDISASASMAVFRHFRFPGKGNVNRRGMLTPYRLPTLTPLLWRSGCPGSP